MALTEHEPMTDTCLYPGTCTELTQGTWHLRRATSDLLPCPAPMQIMCKVRREKLPGCYSEHSMNDVDMFQSLPIAKRAICGMNTGRNVPYVFCSWVLISAPNQGRQCWVSKYAALSGPLRVVLQPSAGLLPSFSG